MILGSSMPMLSVRAVVAGLIIVSVTMLIATSITTTDFDDSHNGKDKEAKSDNLRRATQTP